VDLELFLLGNSYLGKKLANIVPLVALQLNNLPVFWVFNHSAVAGKVLLTCPYNLLLVEVVRDALDGGQCFASISLLDSNVDQTILYTLFVTTNCIRKWIKSLQILNARHT